MDDTGKLIGTLFLIFVVAAFAAYVINDTIQGIVAENNCSSMGYPYMIRLTEEYYCIDIRDGDPVIVSLSGALETKQ